jgi:hypothetical protein
MLARILFLFHAACLLILAAANVDLVNTRQAEIPRKFIWLMQGKEALDLSFLRSEQSDAIQVPDIPVQKKSESSVEALPISRRVTI